MNQRTALQAHVDELGRLVLPAEAASRLGLTPGSTVQVEEDGACLLVHEARSAVRKLYVEPTTECNLRCRTCIRNAWDEPTGEMSEATYKAILDGLKAFPAPVGICFSGYGEPLAHPGIADMVAQAKAQRASVELVTNGTMLNERLARDLISARLNVLWVSLDGASPRGYAEIRLGGSLSEVLANIERFRDLRRPGHRPRPEIGVVFVAMKRNMQDLPPLLELSRQLGATRFLVTNVLPHTAELRDEILYARALSNSDFLPSVRFPNLWLPKMDTDELSRPSLYQAVGGAWNIQLSRQEPDRGNDRCPFIQSSAMAVGWDGSASPCLPLLHTSSSYLNRVEHVARCWVVGNVNQRGLVNLWEAPEHVAFRRKVMAFDFAPCTSCDGCDLSASNETDCYGNTFPTCGSCLWAQGIVQCP